MTRKLVDENRDENQKETRFNSKKRGNEERMVFQNRLEYLAIFFILQSGNNNFIITASNCAEYKGISFLILYYSIHHIAIAPLQCQHLFLGFYSKFGYMKVWNIFPIGYGNIVVYFGTGIGASMMAFSIYTCVNWSSLTGQLLLQFVLIPFLPDNYWADCTYESKNLPPCFNLSSKGQDIDCNKTYYPAVAQYYRVSNLWRPDQKPDGIGPLHTKWIAALALVWIITGILTVRDLKSFKGVFAKLGYSVTTISFLMIMLQWANQGHSQEGTLLMLDFTGLYSYKVWVKALTHAILMSHICEGTIIQLGSYGPKNVMPDTDALLVGFLTSVLQYLEIFYVYSSYGIMADIYALDMDCFIWPNEAIIIALTPTRLSLLPMARLWILIDFLILLIKSIMEMTIVFTATVNSFSEAFPSVEAYRPYVVGVLTLSCFSMSLIFTTKIAEIFSDQFLEFVGNMTTMIILAIMSSLILFSYSVTRLCDDIQFMHKFEPTLIMRAVFYLTPLVATYYAVSYTAMFLSFPNQLDARYNDLWGLNPFLIVSCVGIITPLVIVALYMYGIHVRTHTVELLFRPTQYWGYPDEEVNEARRSFNPRRDLRYMVNKPCAHVCLLDDERMQKEIQKREAIRTVLKIYGLETMNQEV